MTAQPGMNQLWHAAAGPSDSGPERERRFPTSRFTEQGPCPFSERSSSRKPASTPATTARHGRLTALLRAWWWRIVWWLCGGLYVQGPRPAGPAVIVANHRSHADSAALLAALPHKHPPVFAAAADYWFTRTYRRWAVAVAMPALPVARTGAGAYLDLRAAAARVLADGGVVVVYPEGTRGDGGELGEFRLGAARLARDLGVPLVPVAIDGTQHVLPKNGRLRRHPVTVRFGTAVKGKGIPATADELRALVAGLLAGTHAPEPGRLRRLVTRLMTGPRAWLAGLAWGFAEAWSWPLLPELMLLLFAVVVPHRMIRQAIWLATGSVAGIVSHAWLASHGVQLPLPLTTPAMATAAAQDLAAGPWGLMHQMFSGIPVKVYAAQAGAAGLDPVALGLVAVVERFTRILAVAAVLAVLAGLARPLLRRHYPVYLAAASGSFVIILNRVLAAW